MRHSRQLICATAAPLLAFVIGLPAQAATLSAVIDANANAQSLLANSDANGIPARGGSFSWSRGIANLATMKTSVTINSGTLNSEARLSFNAEVANIDSVANAKSARVEIAAPDLKFTYSTEVGAKARVDVDVWKIGVDIPIIGSVGWEPPNVTLFDEGFLVEVSDAAGAGFDRPATTQPSDTISRVSLNPGIPSSITDFLGANADIFAELKAVADQSLAITGAMGQVVATHRDTGTTRTQLIDLENAASLEFDLGLAGLWDLSLADVILDASFYSSYKIQPKAGFEIMIQGLVDYDYSTSFDFRIFDATFDYQFNAASASLGSVEVGSEVSAVPLPASVLMLLAGIGALGLGARFRI